MPTQHTATTQDHTVPQHAVRWVQTREQFFHLRRAWDILHESVEDASVFTTWEWIDAWWTHYGREGTLRVLVVEEAGRTMGILPLYISTRRRLGVVVRKLALLGSGGDTLPDYLGPIFPTESARMLAATCANAIFHAMSDWDVLELAEMAESSVGARALEEECSARSARSHRSEPCLISYSVLGQTWDQYLSGLSAHRRKNVRNIRSKAERTAGARLRVVKSGEELDSVFHVMADLHRKRFRAKDVRHSFSSDAYIDFHRQAIHACARHDWIRFYVLELDGRTAAVMYCYLHRHCMYLFQVGMDPERMALRPGSVLLGYAIENAIGEGVRIFDFLRGDHEYKKEWGRTQRVTSTTFCYRAGIRPHLHFLAAVRIPAFKRWIKCRLSFLDRRHGHA